MKVRYSCRLLPEKIFTEKRSWETKWSNKKDNCKLLAEASSKHDHEAIPQMKRDTCIRVSSPQHFFGAQTLSRKTQPPRMQFSKWDSISPNNLDFFKLLRLKKVRTSLTEKEIQLGSWTPTGKKPRDKNLTSQDFIFLSLCCQKILNLKMVWVLQNFTASYCYSVTPVNDDHIK